MIADLKPYPKYKETDLPWLGNIPSTWKLERTKRLFRYKKKLNTDRSNTNVLSLTLRGVVNNDPENPEGLVPKDYGTYQFFSKNDLVFKLIDLENLRTSRVGLVRENGIMSPAYIRLIPNDPTTILFFFHQFYDLYQRGVYNQLGAGVRSTLGPSDLLNLPIVVPPPDEQITITRFLDYANRRIASTIRAKRKVIALLNEQKQNIINHAVTRGLDPKTPLKPSGIPWLGEIPEHWDLASLRRHWQVVDCKHLTVPFVEYGIPLASVSEVQSFSIDLSNCKRTTTEWYRVLIEGGRAPKRGNLIYCRNVSVGACAYVDTDIDFAMGQDVCLIRSQEQNQRYLNYLLHSHFMAHQLELLLVGSTFKRINISQIKALIVIVPPLEEQNQICSYLDTELSKYDAVLSRTEREISLLREFRTRLIADVVTGKLDVREVAKDLPDEADESDIIDDNEIPAGYEEMMNGSEEASDE